MVFLNTLKIVVIGIPAKLNAYFRNERGETLVSGAMEHNPVKVFQHYIEQGNKEKFLQQPMQNILDYLNKNVDKIPHDVTEHLLYDMSVMSGHHQMAGMTQVANFLQAFHEGLGKIPGLGKMLKPTDSLTGYNMFHNLMSLSYLTKVAYRPWAGVRAMLTPYQTLAPRIGISEVSNAMHDILGDGGQAHMKRYMDRGDLLLDVPATTQFGEGAVSKITRKGMAPIQTGDDIGRGIALRAGENLIADGARSWQMGKFNGDVAKFMKFTKLDKISSGQPRLAAQIAQLATSGDPSKLELAQRLFGKELSTEANPTFSQWAQPHAFTRSVPGYLFGRMSSWSETYRESIYRGWENSQGFVAKAAFVASTIGVGWALSKACKAIGIDGKDFTPGFGTLFGGGPQFETAYNILQAPSNFVRGSAGRTQVERAIASEMAPVQAHYISKMLEAVDEGNIWNALLAATSAPVLK